MACRRKPLCGKRRYWHIDEESQPVRISSRVCPAASRPRSLETGNRKPRMQGFPVQTLGLTVIRANAVAMLVIIRDQEARARSRSRRWLPREIQRDVFQTSKVKGCEDFADALFAAWLGANPVQEDLKIFRLHPGRRGLHPRLDPCTAPTGARRLCCAAAAVTASDALSFPP